MEQSEMKIKIQNQEIPNFRGFIVPKYADYAKKVG